MMSNKTLLATGLFILLFAVQHTVMAQDASRIPSRDSVYNLFDVDSLPVFPGREAAFQKYLRDNFQPKKNIGLTSVLMAVKFIIDEEGKVLRPEIIKDNTNGEYIGALLEAITSMPDWKPAEINNIPVKTWFTLPIRMRFE